MINNFTKIKKNKLSLFLIALGFNSVTYGQCFTPTLVTATPSVACSGSTVNLNASTAGTASIKWYTVPSGGTSLGTSLNSANFPITAVSTTTYYAESFIPSVSGSSMLVSYTGAMQTLVVPSGVTQITVIAAGAQGASNSNSTAAGGLGGSAAGILTVTPGDVLNLFVGGQNGFNGGGIASNTACVLATGGNGGGATDIRLNGVSLANRVIVAGGGGGAGGDRVATCGRGSGGGGGGGYYGGGGGAAWPQTSTVVATGGDQTAGGVGGTSSYATAAPGNNGLPGSLGFGGNGGIELSSNQAGSQTGAVGAAGGGTIGLNGTYSGNFSGGSGAGGSSYIGGVLSGSTTSGVQSGNGQIIIFGINGFGCTSASRAAVVLSVQTSPTVSASNGTICAGSNFTISPSGANTYTAQGGSLVVNPSSTTSYTVNGSSSAGCLSANVATVLVTVNATPTVNVTGNSIICGSGSNLLTASGASTYSWNTGATTTTITVSPTVSTIYTVTGVALNGCVKSTTVNQVVSSNPTVTANSGSICLGSTFTISASGASSYTYSGGSPVVSPTVTSTYTITGTNTVGCTGSTSSTVTVNSIPAVSLSATSNSICVNGSSITLTGSPSGGVYTGSNVAGNVFTPGSSTLNATVVYSYTNASGCSNTASTTINVLSCTSLEKSNQIENQLFVYPNPSNGEFVVELPEGLNKTIYITDISGRKVYTQTTNNKDYQVNITGLSKGVYLLHVTFNEHDKVIKIVKD